jgi:hypothetical protein
VPELENRVARNPLDFGAQLDLAVALCHAGIVVRAQRLLLWLDAQPDVPPGIADVIGWYRLSSVCRETTSPLAWVPKVFASAGGGHSNNLNLGPSADRIFISGLGQELELSASSRPLAAPVRQLEGGATWDLGLLSHRARGWNLSLYGQALRYADQPNFALNSVNALLGWRLTQEHGTQTEVQAGVARLTLDEGTRLAAQTLHAVRMVDWGERGALGAVGTLTLVDYAQRAALDGRQLDLRLRAQWFGPQIRLTTDAGWVEDREVRDRPGGDRRGAYLQAQAQWANALGTSAEVLLRSGIGRDREAYLPGLFGDLARRQLTTQATFGLRQRLAPGLHLRLDSRWNRARDALPLFTYSSRTAIFSLEWTLSAPAASW